jgi:hypothetical protein
MGSTLAPGRTTSNAVDRAVAFPLAPPEDIPSLVGAVKAIAASRHLTRQIPNTRFRSRDEHAPLAEPLAAPLA